MSNLLFAYVTGLGNPSDWNGLLPFIQGINDIDVLGGHWDNPESLREIADAMPLHQLVFLAGHSHGGWRAIEIASGKYGPVAKIDVLLTLDPVPPMDEGWEAAANPVVPACVGEARCYYGSFDPLFGKPFQDDPRASNIKLNLGHASFPGALEVRDYIGLKIQELYNT